MFGAALQTCLGSMFPTADTWDFVQLSPRLSDLLHVLSLAGTQQLGYLGGRRLFRHRLGNPKYGSVNLCPSGSVLHLVCTGQV